MKPLEITKLRHFCETRQGFFLITLLESSGFFFLSLILDF